MKPKVLLIIFLLIWFGVAAYLVFLDRQIKKIKQKLFFQEQGKKSNE